MIKQLYRTLKNNKPILKTWSIRLLLMFSLAFGVWYFYCLPDVLFSNSTATVLLDKDGNLLGARIAQDGQWRFAPSYSLSTKFETCLLEFEDRTFKQHHGISARGIGRALVQNFKHKRVVSGGSTITMQLARLMRKNPKRTFSEKIIEMILATRLEWRCNKKEIINYYAANAPFGNNVVGIEAAAWRYFGRNPVSLSWAENATLAVLPNAPGLIYPGKNHQRLLDKRNRLLKRLFEIKVLDKTTYQLALAEPLPLKPLPLPQLAPHLLSKLIKGGNAGKTLHSTIDGNLQQKATLLLATHHELLKENKIYNGAVMITSVKTGKVLVYIGNTTTIDAEHGRDVDCLSAARSTGSILKPLLYLKSLEDGLIAPEMLLPDIPTQFGSYAPKNFSHQYDGAVPAGKVLARSLNIPMVRLLNDYGLEKFHGDLKNLGINTISKPAKYYGLSLILGGAEARPCELTEVYTQLAQELRFGKIKPMQVLSEQKKAKKKRGVTGHKKPVQTNAACIYSTFEAMVEVNRPDEDGNWLAFASAQKIAWKTGTSFGFRDGWAIGITPDYVVTVWIGNADGEGRPGLTGIKAAAPLLFDIFAQLPRSSYWFQKPKNEFYKTAICSQSGYRASELCEKVDSVLIPKTCLNTTACIYHHMVHLSNDGAYRVDSECENIFNMKHSTWFVLPPLIEKYYRNNHPNYKPLPDYKPECLTKVADRAFAILYPKPNGKIYVPVELDGA
ncbi:MAG: penicillin-binding protein 1C, partial [Bacteroidia bacterium]|nr:penicillin-binding protein 1C [Bacteroidia bacterium]